MSDDDAERLAVLLRMLAPAPQDWIEAAQQLLLEIRDKGATGPSRAATRRA
jgi:hypothetical protein